MSLTFVDIEPIFIERKRFISGRHKLPRKLFKKTEKYQNVAVRLRIKVCFQFEVLFKNKNNL